MDVADSLAQPALDMRHSTSSFHTRIIDLATLYSVMHVQKLKTKERVEISKRGQKLPKLLHMHASQFASNVIGTSGSEECEREIQQEQEAEQEMEEEVHHERVVARCETDWACWQQALKCRNLNVLRKVASSTLVRLACFCNHFPAPVRGRWMAEMKQSPPVHSE
jgi:hypothetical protein